MSEDIETQLAAIRTRLAGAQRARSRAEHERDAAEAWAKTARKQLADEFGVHTAEQARAQLASLEAELHQQVEQLRIALDRIEQTGG
jgi:uncharacterized protein (DUF3084 family)